MYKIFIVEDDSGTANEIKNQTQSWGYEVRAAENFRNILEEFSEFQPHITES